MPGNGHAGFGGRPHGKGPAPAGTSPCGRPCLQLPGLGADLGVDPAATAWVLLAYALPMAAIAMTVGPAVAALSWTVAGGGTAGFRAGVVVLTAAALAGFFTLLAPARRPAGAGVVTPQS